MLFIHRTTNNPHLDQQQIATPMDALEPHGTLTH